MGRRAWQATVHGVTSDTAEVTEHTCTHDSSIFRFLRSLYTVLPVAVSIYIPTSVLRQLPLFTPSPAFIVHRFFDYNHSELGEVIPHCSFDLHFSPSFFKSDCVCVCGIIYIQKNSLFLVYSFMNSEKHTVV